MRSLSIIYLGLIIFNIAGCNSLDAEDPVDPLERLMEGNSRFAEGKPKRPDGDQNRVKELKSGQHPLAVVISCSDSRVPAELIFDQGLGSIFSVRTAGNIIGDYELGSIEYAVEKLGCSMILVLGHESCGAVDAFVHHKGDKHQDHIKNIIQYIENEEEEKIIPDSLKNNLDMAVRANILHGVHTLKKSMPVLKPLVESGKLKIVGARYDLDDGRVEILNEAAVRK